MAVMALWRVEGRPPTVSATAAGPASRSTTHSNGGHGSVESGGQPPNRFSDSGGPASQNSKHSNGGHGSVASGGPPPQQFQWQRRGQPHGTAHILIYIHDWHLIVDFLVLRAMCGTVVEICTYVICAGTLRVLVKTTTWAGTQLRSIKRQNPFCHMCRPMADQDFV